MRVAIADCGCLMKDYQIEQCPLHGAATELLQALKDLLKQERVQRATQATDIGLATAADRAMAAIAKAESR